MKNKKNIKSNTLTSIPNIRWLPRYSTTMQNDEMGRWARVAYAGKFDKSFHRGKICHWEIAWVKKLEFKGKIKFSVSYLYPSNGKHLFDNVPEAKREVLKTFRWFIRSCSGNH